MIRYFWKYRYLNFLFILICCIFCILNSTTFNVYFDSERIIELSDVDKDIIEKSVDDANLLLISISIPDSLTYSKAKEINLLLDKLATNKYLRSIRSIFNEKVIVNQSFIRVPVKLLYLDSSVNFHKSIKKIKTFNSNFISKSLMNLLFVVKCKDLEDEDDKIYILEYLDEQFSNISDSKINITGQLKSEIYMKKNVFEELCLFTFLSAILCSLILWYFTRDIKLVAISLLSILFSIILSFSLSNFLFGGIELVMIIIPAIIFIITISDFMHLLNTNQNITDKYNLFHYQMVNIGQPVFLTSLTTAIGFLSFTFGSFEPLMRFGIVTTLSIFISLFIIVTLFAFIIDFNLMRGSIKTILTSKISVALSNLVPYKLSILIIFLALSFLGLLTIKIDNYLTDEVNQNSELYQEINHFEKYFGGIKPLSFTLNSQHDIDSYINFLEANDINIDLVLNRKDTTLVKTRIQDIGTLESSILYDNILAYSEKNNINLSIGGVGYLFDQVSNKLTYEVLFGLLSAIFLIGFIFVFLNNFNIRYLFVSLIPNLIPLFSCLGLMSLFGFYISLSNAFIFAIVFGLIVDDSIHIISAYSINRKKKKSIEDSIRYCEDKTYKAVIKTSVIIVVSLIPLLFSEFRSISQLAIITILSAVIALIFDVLFLPVLLRRFIK